MASFLMKDLVTNDGIDPLKMASTVYENGIDRLRKGNQRRRTLLRYFTIYSLIDSE